MAQIGLSVKGLTDESMSQEQQIKRVISYLRKLEDELRYVLSNLDEGNLSQELTQVIDSKAAKSETKIIEDAVARTRTEMKRDGQQIEMSVQRILDGEDSVSALNTGEGEGVRVVITKDNFSVNVNGGDAEMMLDETGAAFLDLTVSRSFSAPDVARSIDGGSYTIGAGGDYATLSAFAEGIRGRVIMEKLDAHMISDLTEEATLSGVSGDALEIHGDGHTLTGYIHAEGVHSVELAILDMNIVATRNAAPIELKSVSTGRVWGCNINGNGLADVGISISKGQAELYACNIQNATIGLMGTHARIQAIDLKGQTAICMRTSGDIVHWSGTRPSGWVYYDTLPSITVPADVTTLTVDLGTGEPPVTPSVKYEGAALTARTCAGTGSWSYWPRGTLRQGAYGNTPNKGCMWFDNAAIRSTLAGRTVTACTLTLKRVTGAGQTGAVRIVLRGMTVDADAAPSTILSNNVTAPVYGGLEAELGSINRGATETYTVPVAFANALIAGTIQGLCLYNGEAQNYKSNNFSENYARLCGTAAEDDFVPVLSITAQ